MSRQRVVVWLDVDQVAALEAIVRHRRPGPRSRSAVVREAVGWLLVREAVWLLRYHAAEAERAQREAELQAALAVPRAERDAETNAQLVAAALRIIAADQSPD